MSKFRVTSSDGFSIVVDAADAASAKRQGQLIASRIAPAAAVGQAPLNLARPAPALSPTRAQALAQGARQQQDFIWDDPVNRIGRGDVAGLLADAVRGSSGRGAGEPAHQFTRQATFGLSDALSALEAAGGQGLQNFVGGLLGKPQGPSMAQVYDANRTAQMARTKEFDSPVNTAAGVLGGLVGPAPAAKFIQGAKVLAKGAPLAARAARLGGQMMRAVPVGAAIGATSGAANAPTLSDIPVDAGLGGVGGAEAAPALVLGGAGAGKVIGLAQRLARPAARKLTGAVVSTAAGLQNVADGTPTAIAPQVLAWAKEQAAQYLQQRLDQLGMTPEQLALHPHVGRGITVAEAAGPALVSEVVGLTKRPGTTGGKAFDELGARGGDIASRLKDDLHFHTGISPELANGGTDAVLAKGRIEAKPMFEAALGPEGSPGKPVQMDQELAALSQRPSIKRAIQGAISSFADAGIDATSPGMVVDPDTGAFATGDDLKSIIEQQPTARAWNFVRGKVRGLIKTDKDGQIIRYGPDWEANKNIMTAAGDLTDALRAKVPGLSGALDRSGDYLKVQEAADRAKNMLFNKAHTADDVGRFVQGLATAPERQAVAQSFAKQFYDKADAGDLRPSLFAGYGGGTRNILADKLGAVFGPDAASHILSSVHAESAMQATGGRMKPLNNSTTGEAAAAAAEHDVAADDAVRQHLGKLDWKKAIGSAVGAGFDKAFSGAQSPASQAFRNSLGDLLLMSPADLPGALAQHPLPRPNLGWSDVTPNAIAPAANVIGQQAGQ